jgi:hypothetical protein
LSSGDQTLPPEVEQYVDQFSRRYREEKVFRDLVHRYLKLSPVKRLGLSLGSMLGTESHRRRTEELIRRYAIKAHQAMLAARSLPGEEAELRRAEQALRQQQEQAERQARTCNIAESSFSELVAGQDQAWAAVEADLSAAEARAEEEERQACAAVAKQTDLEQVVQETLKEQLEASAYLSVDEDGSVRFEEQMLERRLEELFLQEIIDGIEAQTGAGFMAGLGESYDGVISHWAEMESLSELPEVDWVQSIIYARTRGYSVPRYPYLITGKYEGPRPTSIDSAISVDTSLSMSENNRMEVAKKTALATRALMRRLNPANQTFLSHFSRELNEVSSGDFVKAVKPRGGTRTELALEWMLEKLAGGGPAMGYLITDGEPSWPDRAIEAAARFTDHPEVLLRVFLVDGDAHAQRVVREMGNAAGERTRVIPVTAEELPCGVIQDVAVVIDQMIDITEF